MRKQLAKIQDGKKHTFLATMERYGSFIDRTTGEKTRTILLKNITDTAGKILTDHVWVREDSYLRNATLAAGKLYSFEAKVGTYDRGRTARDYRLTKIRKIATA
ncbi:MAG: hypothetical protein K6E34_13000 [Lachnospiraceae bacterium]|nr:hypothetical protein [Lachnospiraceae bacterium]